MELQSRRWKAGLSFVVASFLVLGGAGFFLSQTTVSPESIHSSVTRAEDALDRAWKLPAAMAFGRKVSWQSNASLCGPASLANVLRSFGEPASTESAVLAGSGLCWTGYCILGLTLDELASLARTRTGRKVTVLRDLSAEQFREHLLRANDPGRRYIINFDRKAIFGGGAGHHSPIGGYLEREDLAFVLDVNRVYQPWLVERMRLFDAMNTWDGNRKRGMLLIE
jgi:hypothetical protein